MQRTFASYNPRSGRDLSPDRNKLIVTHLGNFTATTSKLVFRAPSIAKITRLSLMAESTVPGLNQSYWSFDIVNSSKGNLSFFSTAPTTQPVSGGNPKGTITADTEYGLGTIQNEYVAANDVLTFTATKTGSAGNITNLVLLIEYEVKEGPIPATMVTTTSTTTTITTTSSSTTTTSSSTTTTSSSTTTTSSSTTTTSSSTSTSTTTTTTLSTTTTIT